MYKNQRRIKELTPYIPAVDIFRIYEREPGAAFWIPPLSMSWDIIP